MIVQWLLSLYSHLKIYLVSLKDLFSTSVIECDFFHLLPNISNLKKNVDSIKSFIHSSTNHLLKISIIRWMKNKYFLNNPIMFESCDFLSIHPIKPNKHMQLLDFSLCVDYNLKLVLLLSIWMFQLSNQFPKNEWMKIFNFFLNIRNSKNCDKLLEFYNFFLIETRHVIFYLLPFFFLMKISMGQVTGEWLEVSRWK